MTKIDTASISIERYIPADHVIQHIQASEEQSIYRKIFWMESDDERRAEIVSGV